MKKIFTLIALLACTNSYANRPEAVQEAVDKRFEEQFTAKTNDIDNKESYYHADYYLKEYKVVKSIISAAPQQQKHFYFMDLNARNGSWAKEIAKLIDQDGEIAADIEVTFYSVNEENGSISVSETEKCSLIIVNGFKIEDFDTAFADMTGDGEILLDYVRQDHNLVESDHPQKSFPLLIDQLGTFIKIFKNMKKGALAKFDGFSIFRKAPIPATCDYQSHTIFCDKAQIETFSVNDRVYFLKSKNSDLPYTWSYSSELSAKGAVMFNIPTSDIIKSGKNRLSKQMTKLLTTEDNFVQSLTNFIRVRTQAQQVGAADANHNE